MASADGELAAVAIGRMPCTVRLLKVSSSVDFWDFDEYERLGDAARGVGSTCYLVELLGVDAGLRAGEMRALHWTDVDFTTGKLRIECNEWYGHITTTKGNRVRYVPITGRLREALREHRHLRGAGVLDIVGVGQDLEELLDRRVDVLTGASLHPGRRDRILAESRPLYKDERVYPVTSATQ